MANKIKTSTLRAPSGVVAGVVVVRGVPGRKAHLVNRKRALPERRWDVVRVADLFERQDGKWVRVRASVSVEFVDSWNRGE